jgi:hypothetical protein
MTYGVMLLNVATQTLKEVEYQVWNGAVTVV